MACNFALNWGATNEMIDTYIDAGYIPRLLPKDKLKKVISNMVKIFDRELKLLNTRIVFGFSEVKHIELTTDGGMIITISTLGGLNV